MYWLKKFNYSERNVQTKIQFIQDIIDTLKNKKQKRIYSTKLSYSQCGDDLIVDFILNEIFKKNKINFQWNKLN